ncbi:MAG: LysR family transcriptional regulator [Pseudomonadota bacterium]
MAKIPAADVYAQMEAFVLTVEQRGLSAAARRKEVAPSTISKLITRLEERLGARLLNRTTRRLSLTPEGERFYERCRDILAALEDAENEVSRARERPRGKLRMSVFAAFSTYAMVPALPRFLARYPEVEVELRVSDTLSDLVAEGIDLGVRLGPLADQSLVAHKICDLYRIVCAAPAYLARAGTPRTPAELDAHNCIVHCDMPELSLWPFRTADGIVTRRVRGNATVNNGESMVQLALRGLGIVRVVDLAAGEAIRRGELVPLLTDSHYSEPVPVYAVHLPGRHRLPRVAAMLQFLKESFAHAPWR